MSRFNSLAFAFTIAAVMAAPSLSNAETRITYKSAKSTSSYYQMGVQLAEAVKKGSNGNMILTVEESQGSVQNVMEAATRQGNYVFTTPPGLIKLAQGGKKMFEPKDARFDEIRGLFPIPSLTMHFVVRQDSGVTDFAGLDGKTFLIGKGSFGASEAEKYLGLFGLEGKVKLAEVELSSAVSALKNKQIDGFATAGSYPAPNVLEAAASTPVNVLSLSDDQIAQTKRTRLVIPAGTYAGVNKDVSTTTLPVMAYTTTTMDDATAYELTETYWENKAAMGETAKWWNGVTPEYLVEMAGKLHPGALKYYDEKGMKVPDALR
jgi:TRAP transporter TAXI family solute receptor